MANKKKEREYTLAISQESLSRNVVSMAPVSNKQEQYIQCKSDFVFFGGGMNCGKTHYSVMALLNAVDDPNFSATVIRDDKNKVKQAGGLWSMSTNLFPKYGAKGNAQDLMFKFPSGSEVKYGHLKPNKAEALHQGANNTMIIIDEIVDPDITEWDVMYLTTRLRSASRQKHRMLATGNPNYHSFMRKWLEAGGYVDPDTGFAIDEMNGVETCFAQVAGEVVFTKNKKEMLEKFGKYACENAMTFTAIHSTIADNPFALKYDSSSLHKMENLTPADRDRLLYGCWRSTDYKGYMQKDMFKIIDCADIPLDKKLVEVRAWDFAASRVGENGEKAPDATVGIKGLYDPESGDVFITHMERFFESFAVVEERMIKTARQDGTGCIVSIPVDAGAAGKQVAQQRKAKLLRERCKVILQKTSSGKLNRATPFIQAVQSGQVHVVRGVFDDDQWRELELFDGSRSSRNRKDDVPDACADMYNAFQKGLLATATVKIGSSDIAKQRLKRLGGKTLL